MRYSDVSIIQMLVIQIPTVVLKQNQLKTRLFGPVINGFWTTDTKIPSFQVFVVQNLKKLD